MNSIKLPLSVAAMLALAGNSSQAAIISNPGFLFNFAGHTSGDSGHSISLSPTNTPFWKPATTSGGFTPNVTDPQGIFANNLNEYLQIQIHSGSGGSMDAYQQITIPTVGEYTLTMDAGRRTDNLNFNGTMILELWSGNVTSFSSGSPITPDSLVSPTLSGTLQQFSRTYSSLAPGAYTVRVGGTYVGPSAFFQASIDNVNMVPEPASFGLLGIGMMGLIGRRRR
jgi:PEP-CTERM motif